MDGQSTEFLDRLPVREYWDIVRRRRWYIILTAILVTVATAVVVYRMPNTYRAETVILVDPQKVPDSYVTSTVSASIADRLSTIQQQVMSPSRLKRIIDTLNLYPEMRKRSSEQEVVEVMQQSTLVEVVNPGGQRLSAFRIAFHGRNAVEVAQVANQLASMFIEENLRVREQQSYGTAEFLESELLNTKKQLQEKEAQLQQIRSRYVTDLPESKQFHLEALTNLRARLRASEDQLNRAQQEKVYLQSVLISTAPTVDLDAGGMNPRTSTLQTQIQKIESNLSDLRSRYGPNYPDVRKLQNQLDELKKRTAVEEKNQPGAEIPAVPARPVVHNPVIEAQLRKLDQEIADQAKFQGQLQPQIDFHMQKLEQVPFFEQQIGGLMRDYDSLRAHYTSLLDKKLAAEMSSALESRQKAERFVILDPATVPEKPYGPKRGLFDFAGLLGGLLGGIGLAMVVEMADESVRTDREASRILGVTAMVSIPTISTRRQKRNATIRAFAMVAGTLASSAVLGLLVSYLGRKLF